eukprot:768113-Hanusia_phi.AAC.2
MSIPLNSFENVTERYKYSTSPLLHVRVIPSHDDQVRLPARPRSLTVGLMDENDAREAYSVRRRKETMTGLPLLPPFIYSPADHPLVPLCLHCPLTPHLFPSTSSPPLSRFPAFARARSTDSSRSPARPPCPSLELTSAARRC